MNTNANARQKDNIPARVYTNTKAHLDSDGL